MVMLLMWFGMFLPLQDPDLEQVSRFRDVMVVRATVNVIQTDRGNGEILANRDGLTLARIPAGSTKATLASGSRETSQVDLKDIDPVDFSGGLSVTVQVLDDAVEIEREESDEPVAVVVYVEKEGEESRFFSGIIVSAPGKTRVPVPPDGVAYLLSPGGFGLVVDSPAPSLSGESFLSGISISTDGIFGFELDVNEASDLNTIQTVFNPEAMQVSQTFHLETETYSLAKLELGFKIFPWLTLSLAGFYGSFEGEGELRTDLECFVGTSQVSEIEVKGTIYGFEPGIWVPFLRWNPSDVLEIKIGNTASLQWIHQEYEEFSRPEGDRGGAPELYDFTSELEGGKDRFLSWSTGIRSSIHWSISPSAQLGFQVQPQWNFGDFSGVSLDGGLSLELRF